jgi:cell division septation protein DedD
MASDDAPWLQPAEPPGPERPGGRLGRLIGLLVVLALVAVALVWFLTSRAPGDAQGYMEASQAPLITAEPGPFKLRPDNPRGLDVEGQDQTLYAAGAGIDGQSDIDLSATPEEPMPRPGSAEEPPAPVTPAQDLLPPAMRGPAPTPAPARPAAAAAARPPAAPSPAPAPAPAAAPAPRAAPPATPGRTVQLGAFSTRARAEAAWAALAAKHGMLSFTPSYAAIERDGQTLWRLRATGGDAAALCQRLASTNDSCTVVRE